MYMLRDNRSYYRYKTKLNAKVHFSPDTAMSGWAFIGALSDISIGGALIESPFSVLLGTEAKIDVFLPRLLSPYLKGVLCRQDSRGMAFKFDGINNWIASDIPFLT